VDKIDRHIMKFLLVDARTSFSGIANHLGVSVDTVSKRYAKLKKQRVIKSTTIFIDPEKIGGGLIACLNINAETGGATEVAAKLGEIEEIFLLGKTFGVYDFFAIVATTDLKKLDELRDKISSLHQVKACDVSILTSGLDFIPSNQLPEETQRV
jgi:DNA-binding Lrp family transcriptional regulator